MTDIILEPQMNPDDIKKLKHREQKREWARKNRAKLMEYNKGWVERNVERYLELCRPHKAAYAKRERAKKLFLDELHFYLYKEFDVELDIDPLI